MFLDPLRRANQSEFLTIPECELDRPLRLPSAFCQFRQGSCRLEYRYGAANRIVRAIIPCVMMIAVDHPLIWKLTPCNSRDHVEQRLGCPIKVDGEPYCGLTRPDVIGDRQRSTPCLRRHWSAEIRKQRLGLRIRNRQYGNAQDRLGLVTAKPSRSFFGCPAG